jgi:four helix bundle protein
MLKNFKTYKLALDLHKGCQKLKLTGCLKDQMYRASLSVVLNTAEATGKPTRKDQNKFYAIALGSLRETQALLDVIEHRDLDDLTDQVGACLWVLSNRK